MTCKLNGLIWMPPTFSQTMHTYRGPTKLPPISELNLKWKLRTCVTSRSCWLSLITITAFLCKLFADDIMHTRLLSTPTHATTPGSRLVRALGRAVSPIWDKLKPTWGPIPTTGLYTGFAMQKQYLSKCATISVFKSWNWWKVFS